MKLWIRTRAVPGGAGLVLAVALLAGCGTADEAESSSASAESPAVSSVSSVSTATSTTDPVPPAESSDVSAAASAAPSAGTSGTGSPPPGPLPGTSTPAPLTPDLPAPAPGTTEVPPPTTFADPEEVEAQGLATNPLCEVLSVEEVGALLGAPVRPAVDTAAGTGCLWSGSASDTAFLQLQMLGDPVRYVQPAGAEIVPGIGDAAFVVPSDGGWTAQAQNPDGTFGVQVAGATATREGVVEGLRRLLERY